jgi:SMODS and SLOG-associating 2TM effector domain 1/SMODS and SLOG-associating 2TM effector domain 3
MTTTEPSPSPPAGNAYPFAFAAADTRSKRSQTTYTRLTAAELTLLCVVAFGGAVPIHFSFGNLQVRPFSLLAAVALISALIVRLGRAASGAEVAWFSSRAAAESIKTLTWKFVVCARGFEKSLRPHEADQRFITSCKEVIQDLRMVDPRLVVAEEAPLSSSYISDWMRASRALPRTQRIALYQNARIDDQLSWYRSRAKSHNGKAKTFTRIVIVMYGAAIIGAFIQAAGLLSFDVLGFAAAVAASLESWTQLRRHKSLATAYEIAVVDLLAIRERSRHVNNEEAWAQFVDDAEEAVSREHTTWRANRLP